MSTTRTVSLSRFIFLTHDYISGVVEQGDTLLIEAYGSPTVAVISHAEYEELQAARSALSWDATLRRDREEMDPQ